MGWHRTGGPPELLPPDLQVEHDWDLVQLMNIPGLDYLYGMLTVAYDTKANPSVALDDWIVDERGGQKSINNRCSMVSLDGVITLKRWVN